MGLRSSGSIGWSGTIAEFVALHGSPGSRERAVVPGEAAHPARRQFYREMADCLAQIGRDSLPVIVEFVTPVGQEFVDVVLVSGTAESPRFFSIIAATAIETSEALPLTDSQIGTEGLVRGGAQAAVRLPTILGKLATAGGGGDGTGEPPDCGGAVWEIFELDRDATARDRVDSDAESQCVYSVHSSDAFVARLKQTLGPVGISVPLATRLLRRVKRSPAIIEYHPPGLVVGPEIVESELCARGLGLSAEQGRVRHEVEQAILGSDARVFVVRSRPGSGKTTVAAALYLTALVCRASVRVAAYGASERRLIRSLAVAAGADPGTVQSRTELGEQGRRADSMVPSGRTSSLPDLLIVDDAQFFSDGELQRDVTAARVVVFFVDDHQAALVDAGREVGRSVADWLVGAAFDLRRLVSQLQLGSPKRGFDQGRTVQRLQGLFNGGGAGETAVGAVASGVLSTIAPAFRFDLCASPLEVENRLELLREETDRRTACFGLGASIQAGAALESAGAEYDYIGIVWGDALLYRKDRWILGSAEHAAQRGDSLVVRRGKSVHWCTGALELMKARYLFWLSRAVRGVFVAVEDGETHAFLSEAMHRSYGQIEQATSGTHAGNREAA